MALPNKEISNLACIARVIVGPCTGILQDVLKNQITLSDLRKGFRYLLDEGYLITQYANNVYLLIYEFGANYSDFDITLLYFFLISICNIPVVKPESRRFPTSETDRSLSANIERIYLMHRKYRYFQDGSLKDSTFEKEWKRIFQTVKELEEYIGSDTAHQDTMKKIKNSSMDPDVEHVFIAKLGAGRLYSLDPFDMMQFQHFEMMPVYKSDIQASASRDIEFFLDHYDPRELTHSKEKAKEKSEKYQQITSEKLKELFSSFKVMFPEVDTDRKSFARDILKDDILKIENAIGSLSENVVLNTKKDIWKAKWPKAEARVVEVEVVYDGVEDQFFVSRKGISSDVLTDIPYDEGDCVKVILISSDSIPVVSAKLIAYKNFKPVINEKEIYLQHEYEDFDNVAKLIAYNIVSSFCLYLDSLIHTFTNDLHKIMVDNYDKPLKTEEIRKMCSNVFERTAKTHKPFGSARAFRWSFPISLLIGEQISEENLKGADAWDEIQSVCCNTVEDFKIILSTLEDLKTNEFYVDQEKQIEELLKSDIFPEGLLLECPSIIKYIAGYRQEQEVVKVYLSSDDKEAKTFIRTHCKVSKEALLEFIDVENIDKNQEEEEINPAVAESTIAESMQIIRENGEKILAKYSNVIGIRVGQTGPHCITLYCLDRTIVPFGEHPLPKFIEGRPCNVKEAFFILGTCPLNCTDELPKPGCSIGVPEKQGAGSSTGVPATQGAGSSIGIHSKQDAESRIGLLTKQDVGSSNGVPAKQSEGSRNGVPAKQSEGSRNGVPAKQSDGSRNGVPAKQSEGSRNGVPAKQSDGSRNGVPAKQSEGSRIGLPTKQCAGSSTEVPKKQGAGSSIGVSAKQGEGSSNGVPAKQGAGSVGIFYESKTGSRYGSGFVTAAHVAIESCYHLRYQDKLLSNSVWKKKETKPKHEVVHPKCKHINGEEHVIGDVVESFYGKYKLSPTLFEGLDFAVVKTKHCGEGKREILQFVDIQNLANQEMVMVTKTGKATGKTEGVLRRGALFANMCISVCKKRFYLPGLYIVHDKDNGNPFFEKGDSGSGVFVVGKDNKEYVLGIGIAVNVNVDGQKRETYVCKIDQIIKNLGLTLVRYTEEGQQQTSDITKNSS